MRIIVPIKQVPETNAVRMDSETGTMIRDGVEAIVNPLDLYSIEAALQLRESLGGDCEIVAISMGPPKAAKAIREAIAMGIDSGVLISDRAFAGSDTWATAYVLAAAIRKIGHYDLILCGERATDGDTGQVGPAIAAFLHLPCVSYTSEIESATSDTVRVRRLVETGYELLEMQLPGLVTVVKEIADPRLPTLRGKQRARRIEIPTWGVDDLDIDKQRIGLNGSPTRVVKIFRPTVARHCRKLTPTSEKEIEQAADELVTFLQNKQLI